MRNFKITSIFFLLLIPIFCLSNNEIPAQGKKGKAYIPWIKNLGQFHNDIAFTSKSFAGNIAIYKNRSITYDIKISGNGLVFFNEKFLNSEFSNNFPVGICQSNTKVNFITGNKDEHYVDIPTYDKIDLGEVWTDINMTLIAKSNNYEKIFVVKPYGNPDKINIELDGINDLCKNELDQLQIDFKEGDVCFTKPKAWQNISGKQIQIKVNYKIKSNGENYYYGFELGNYDKNFPVIIDPLIASGFLGGSMFDYAQVVKLGKTGSVYVGGSTHSFDFPSTTPSFDDEYNDSTDIFVARLDDELSKLEVCTFVGGKMADRFKDMVLDENDNLYFTGSTQSENYPITANAYDETYNNPGSEWYGDIFISCLNKDLNQLKYSTYIGSNLDDFGSAIDLDKKGNPIITGISYGGIPAIGPQFNSNTIGFIFFKMDPSLGNLLATNSISGNNYIWPYDIVVDSSDNIIITGYTMATDFPSTPGSFAENLTGNNDAFIVKLSNDITNIISATYVGGKEGEWPYCVVTDSNKDIFICGESRSKDFPFTLSAYDTINQYTAFIQTDAFICKLDSNLSEMKASTLLGGSMEETAYYLAFDSLNNILVTGYTNSLDFPVFCNSYDQSYNGSHDAFISKFSPDLKKLFASTYIGGSGSDHSYSIVLNERDHIYSAGFTTSPNFPVIDHSFDNTYGGEADGFILSINSNLDKDLPCCSELVFPEDKSVDNARNILVRWSQALGAKGYYLSIGNSIDSYNILDNMNVGNVNEYQLNDLGCSDTIYIYINPYNDSGINDSCEEYWFKVKEPFLEDSIAYMCEGESFEWQGEVLNSEGIYTKEFVDIFGCDSIYKLSLFVDPPYYFQDVVDICDGESYEWQGGSYSVAGTYLKEFTTVSHCDSVYKLILDVHPNYDFFDQIYICGGEVFEWEGENLMIEGVYQAFYQTVVGCDSNLTLQLFVDTSYSFYESANICEGESFEWRGEVYINSGNYSKVYEAMNGCDSTYYLHLDLYPSYFFSETVSFCKDDSLIWQDTLIFDSGTYYKYFETINNCDSIYELILEQVENDTSVFQSGDSLIAAISNNSTYQWLTCPGFEIIDGETQSVFVANESGSYAVQIEKEGCIDTSNCHILIHSGLKEDDINNRFNVFPNPVDKILIVQSEDFDQKYSIELFGISGKKILSKEQLLKANKIDVKNIEPGVYILNIKTRNQSITKKIVVF